MKSMLLAFVAIAVIAIGADFLLHDIGFSSAERHSSDSVRLGES
ncbi:MAG: hypothetical protein R3E87_14095 [Burkholderiaceae bacterium]